MTGMEAVSVLATPWYMAMGVTVWLWQSPGKNKVKSNNQLVATVQAHQVVTAIAMQFSYGRKQEVAMEAAFILITLEEQQH